MDQIEGEQGLREASEAEAELFKPVNWVAAIAYLLGAQPEADRWFSILTLQPARLDARPCGFSLT